MKNKNTPLMDLLDKFTAPDVPQFGPGEIPCSVPRFDPTAEPTPENWPGDGLAQHTMLYVGEGCNRMFLVHEGRVIWTCDTGEGWEYDDVWMLKNGDILFSRQSWAGMVSPKKELLWRIDCEPGEEMHTIQPLDDHRCALLVSSDKQPYVIFVDEYTGEIVWVLRDFRWLKECTAVQILDDPGDPEIVCDCER